MNQLDEYYARKRRAAARAEDLKAEADAMGWHPCPMRTRALNMLSRSRRLFVPSLGSLSAVDDSMILAATPNFGQQCLADLRRYVPFGGVDHRTPFELNEDRYGEEP